jgi:hypothetical protein
MSQTIARRTGWSLAVAVTLWAASAWSVGYLTPASACRGEDEFNVRFTCQNDRFRNGSGTNSLRVDWIERGAGSPWDSVLEFAERENSPTHRLNREATE